MSHEHCAWEEKNLIISMEIYISYYFMGRHIVWRNLNYM